MRLHRVARSWLDGCRCLAVYDKIPGYRRLRWLERKRLDWRAITMLPRSRSFWCGAFWVGAANLAMHSLVWHLDLVGPARDLLRALPLLLAFPLLASARLACIRTLLRNRDLAHRQVGRNM